MTTQPTQPEESRSAPVVERVSRLEGIAEQANLRLAENSQAINALRAENHTEHENLRAASHAEFQSLRAENRAEHQAIHERIDRLRAEMHRQTLIVVVALGGLMALFRFLG
ncbi:MAG: hypothetical protein OXE50_07485 [Chloroflexi bacterium]|nr:hypothetical protein [Chloroflexota bacterium]